MSAADAIRACGSVHRLRHWAIAIPIPAAIAPGLHSGVLREPGARALAQAFKTCSIHKTGKIAPSPWARFEGRIDRAAQGGPAH